MCYLIAFFVCVLKNNNFCYLTSSFIYVLRNVAFILLFFACPKLQSLAESSWENGMHCAQLTVNCCIRAFRFDTFDLTKRALWYPLFVWNSQLVSSHLPSKKIDPTTITARRRYPNIKRSFSGQTAIGQTEINNTETANNLLVLDFKFLRKC